MSFIANLLGVKTLKRSEVPNLEYFNEALREVANNLFNAHKNTEIYKQNQNSYLDEALKNKSIQGAFEALETMKSKETNFPELTEIFDSIFVQKAGYGWNYLKEQRFQDDLDLYLKLHHGPASWFAKT